MIKNLTLVAILFFTFKHGHTQDKAYKGAEVYSQSQHYVKYGKIEVRMRAAKGSAILSTFFTWKEGSEQPAVFWEEIDVEVLGKNNAESWQSNIITGFNPINTLEQLHTKTFSLADDFHTYSVEWTPEYVAWSFDGQQVRKISGKPATDLQSFSGIRFNLWASTSVSWAGSWNDNVLPQYQFVNWIKYYRYIEGGFILDWTDDFTSFNTNRWGKADWTFDGNRVDFEPQNALVDDGMLILCITKAGETGFNGEVPVDSADIISDINKNTNQANAFTLQQNFPNPFNPVTAIKYSLKRKSNIKINVYDTKGLVVTTLVNKTQAAGEHTINFDGSGVASGIYFYQFKTDTFQEIRKMILLR